MARKKAPPTAVLSSTSASANWMPIPQATVRQGKQRRLLETAHAIPTMTNRPRTEGSLSARPVNGGWLR